MNKKHIIFDAILTGILAGLAVFLTDYFIPESTYKTVIYMFVTFIIFFVSSKLFKKFFNIL